MNEINYIKVSNVPARHAPADGSPLARGKPLIAVIPKEVRLRDLFIQSTKVKDSSPDESGFGMTSKGGRALLKMRDGPVRNAQRDGPRGREPDTGLARHAVTAGVPVTLYPSVYLCEFSVDSVVKNIKPQRTRTCPTKSFRRGRHREHGEILYMRNHNDFSPVLLGVCPQAGEKNVLRTEGLRD